MCWNPEVSLSTFIFGVICGIIAYTSEVISIGTILILLAVTSMQLVEYFAWIYINNKKIIKILSFIGLHIIFLQILLINWFLPNKKNSRILLLFLIFFYILFLIIQFRHIQFNMTKGKNGHFIWHFLDLPVIWIIIGLSFYLIPSYLSNTNNHIFFYILLITILISLYYYYKDKTWGSMWCHFSNILWILVIINIIMVKLKIIDKNKYSL